MHNSRLKERFDAKWVEDPETGCWLWTASTKGNGYGQIKIGVPSPAPAHRVAYTLYRGAIPDGLVIDHLCRNPGCVNPEHLEAVTHKENLRRGAKCGKKLGPCKNGHPVDQRFQRPGKVHWGCYACKQEEFERRIKRYSDVKPPRQQSKLARNAEMNDRLFAGETLQSIADSYGVTRERVRQITGRASYERAKRELELIDPK